MALGAHMYHYSYIYYAPHRDGVLQKPYLKNKISILNLGVYLEEDRQKPIAQGRVFAMTHRDTQATFDVVESTLRIHTLFSRALINPDATKSFVSVSFAGLLGMSIDNMDFDLFVATPLGESVVVNKTLRDCCVMIGYREMTVDLALLGLQHFDVILGMAWLASMHLLIVLGNK